LKQLRLRLVVLTLLAGLLVPVTAMARVLSVCNMASGLRAKACCCHKGEREAPSCQGPAIDRQACCSTLVSHVEKASATTPVSGGDVPPAVFLERLPAIEISEFALAESERLAPRSRAPPLIGPPLFLRDCKLLS
jgi:hypothetical protein